jgi:hypothetical protein
VRTGTLESVAERLRAQAIVDQEGDEGCLVDEPLPRLVKPADRVRVGGCVVAQIAFGSP